MKKLALLVSPLVLMACEPEIPSQSYTGDFRYYKEIAEFFDCKSQTKHYLGTDGVYDELIAEYQALNMTDGHDVYVRVEGYYLEEDQMDGVEPIELFVPTRIIKIDPDRGCKVDQKMGL